MTYIDDYTAFENATVTYLMVQIAERDNDVALQIGLFNPEVPKGGSARQFVTLTLDQKIAVLSLAKISKVITQIHRDLEQVLKQVMKEEDGTCLMEYLEQNFKALRSA
jgi:hypothetical protein